MNITHQIKYLDKRIDKLETQKINNLNYYDLKVVNSELGILKNIKKKILKLSSIESKVKTLNKHLNEFLNEENTGN